MFNYISGIIADKDNRKAVLESQGIGFEVFCSAKTLDNLAVGQKAKIYTFLSVSDRAIEFYGFLTKQEQESFNILNNVSGIGPKTALGLSAIGSMDKIKEDLEKGEIPSDVKGLGQKRLQKIILELTGKIKEISAKKSGDVLQDDALEALASLGFSRLEAKKALEPLPLGEKTTEERLKEALKFLRGK